MFDQVLDSFRKVSESTIQMQQELFKQWVSQWPTTTPTSPEGGMAEQAQTLQKRWLETVTEMMNRHRESLDAQYKSGIRAIEDAFRVTEAKTPEEYRRMTEDLWRKGFETLKGTAETQIRDFQTAVDKWFELTANAKA
jgi:hypothetical protein